MTAHERRGTAQENRPVSRGPAARREKGGEGCGGYTLVALYLSLRLPPTLCGSRPPGVASPSGTLHRPSK